MMNHLVKKLTIVNRLDKPVKNLTKGSRLDRVVKNLTRTGGRCLK